MIASIFLRACELHLKCGEAKQVYKVQRIYESADNVASFFKDFILKISYNEITAILYSAGPASFTTTRILVSFLKGIAIVYSGMTFIGISSFLTYASVLQKTKKEGEIAIPTMRGDFFLVNFRKDVLDNVKIVPEISDKTITDASKIFENMNLASEQEALVNSELLSKNQHLVVKGIKLNYVFSPKY